MWLPDQRPGITDDRSPPLRVVVRGPMIGARGPYTPAMTAPQPSTTEPSGTTIRTINLACGMPLVVEQSSAVRSVSLTWLLPAGSAADPEDRQGLSAMMAELVFRGAGDRDSRAQADELDRLGLARGCEVGGVFLRLSATMLASRLAETLPRLVDIVRRPKFDPAAIEPTRELALQALAGLQDEPAERAANLLLERHNPVPLNRSGLGTEAGLTAVTREDLTEGWERCVRPRGSILAVAGAVDADAVARQLNELLADWKGTAPVVTPRPSPTAGTYYHEQEPSHQVHIYLAHGAPPEPHADAVLERVVSFVLSGGPSARLFTEVRERRALCYAVSAAYGADKHHGKVTCYVGTTPDKAQQSLDVLLEELRKVSGGGTITREEFDRALVGAKSRLVFAGESMAARAGSLASDMYRLGRARSLAEVAAEFSAVTLERLNAYLHRRTMGTPTVVTLGPTALKM